MSSTLHHAAAGVGKSAPLGPLPEWNLNDLYEGIDAPEVAADLAKATPNAPRSRKPIKASSLRSRPVPVRARSSPPR